MGLKDLQSILDLVPGTGPVGNMDETQGPPFDLGNGSTLQIDSLQIVPGGDSSSPFQDLDGGLGPQFDAGELSTLQQNSLENIYNSAVNPTSTYGAGQPGSTYPILNPSMLDLGGVPGTQFNNGPEPTGLNQIDTIAEIGLEGIYNSVVNPEANYGAGQPGGAWPAVTPTSLDLNGQQGPQFNQGPEPVGPNQIDSFHESALVDIYNSAINPGASYGAGQPGSTYPVLNPSSLAVPGIANQNPNNFNQGPEAAGPNQIDTLHEDLLMNIYESNVNPGASYGAGQPGGAYPYLTPGALDLNGLNQTQYINNLPE